MVKGISKKVILVRPPDTELFEQAIFILKDKTPENGVSSEEVLRQAQLAAERYLRTRSRGGRGVGMNLRPFLYALLGAGSASVLWALSTFLL